MSANQVILILRYSCSVSARIERRRSDRICWRTSSGNDAQEPVGAALQDMLGCDIVNQEDVGQLSCKIEQKTKLDGTEKNQRLQVSTDYVTTEACGL